MCIYIPNMSKLPKKNHSATEKTLEEKYQKLGQHEHILRRPGMYIGSIKTETCPMWVFNDNREKTESVICLKEISYVPGLYKIYDEILVNARDHVVRCAEEKLEPCTQIKVNIDQTAGRITVRNNGAGIPIEENKKHKILIPSMIFGELLAGSSFDDTEKRKVGGMHGLGAKLTNIYSVEFEVETLDSQKDQKFYQKFTDNMLRKHKPIISSGKGKKPYTKISFVPDYSRFGIEGLTDDMLSLFKKRVYDIAMTTTAKVYYNEELIPTNSFSKYIDLYFSEDSEYKKEFDYCEDWKVCVVYDPTDSLEHQNISFVNGICTSRGGSHVEHVANQIVNKLKEYVAKKVKNINIKPSMIKENLIFFVDTVLVNPEFDSQTKETLTTKVAEFSTTYKASEKFIKKIMKTGVVDQIIENAKAKEQLSLQRTGKGNQRFSKLYPAHQANAKNGYKCTLILTEGDSARNFAMAGTNVIGRDYYGIFPLRGKLLNVRDASIEKIINNEEIKAITQIIGLEHKKEYQDTKGLRYGRILILTDQDTDGHHIKGLIMNFIHYFWPSLIKQEGFITSLATPLLKVSKGKGSKSRHLSFTSIQEYEKWKEENNEKGWSKPKYYKGLGTHSRPEAMECFTDVGDKMISYYWQTKLDDKSDNEENNKTNNKKDDDEGSDEKNKDDDEESTESSDDKVNKLKYIDKDSNLVTEMYVYRPKCKDVSEDAISLAFDKKRANDRKDWINTYDPNNYLTNDIKRVSYYDFIHRELIAFSVYDVVRSIPNIMDGFKPSQRKIYCGSILEGIYEHEIKVAQLSGSISKNMAYHHGEQSLNNAIVNMAQDFVGANNINLLLPNGQFGTRVSGGSDAASPRYIYTQLNPLGRKIFIEYDYDILEQQYEEGRHIEPVFYAPIIPMILVNGTDGIGTGYSSTVRPCNPRDICANLKRILNGENPKAMKPWYRHFTGTIEKVDKYQYICRANYQVVSDDCIHISDLPIGVWTDNYREYLDNLLVSGAAMRQNEKKSGKKSNKKPSKKSNKTESKVAKNTGKDTKSSKKGKMKSKTSQVSKSNEIGMYIKNYIEDCTDIRVSFTIQFYPGKLQELIQSGKLEKELKLVVKLSLSNMHLFDACGKIRKFPSYGAILKYYCGVRLKLYRRRKEYLLDKWKKEMEILKWKVKFITDVTSGNIIVYDIRTKTSKKRAEVIARLEELGYPQFQIGKEKKESYSYITTTGLFDLTEDEIKKLQEELNNKKADIENLENKSPKDIWLEEIDSFLEEYDKWEEDVDTKYQSELRKNKSMKKRRK